MELVVSFKLIDLVIGLLTCDGALESLNVVLITKHMVQSFLSCFVLEVSLTIKIFSLHIAYTFGL
jgi:hypothetical protein